MPTTDHSLGTISLLARISGDTAGTADWEQFVQKFWPVIFGWCRDQKMSEADAQDVAQNVLIGLFRNLKSQPYKPELGPFRGWLFRITRNAIVTYYRSQKPSCAVFEDDKVTDDLTSEIAANELLAIAMDRVKTEANPAYWRVFDLVQLQGLSHDETARECNLRLDQVYRYKNQVFKLFEAVLEELNR